MGITIAIIYLVIGVAVSFWAAEDNCGYDLGEFLCIPFWPFYLMHRFGVI